MRIEDDFLQAILADPGDPTPRRIYADWLEERGDPESLRRAEYLRVECDLDGASLSERQRRQLRARLLELRKTIGDDWWRELDWAKVEYCVEFKFRCPQRWGTLQTTDDPKVRHCQECEQEVYYCQSTEEARHRADAGQCVAIDSRLLHLPLQLSKTRLANRRLLGRIAPRLPTRLPLNQRRRISGNENGSDDQAESDPSADQNL